MKLTMKQERFAQAYVELGEGAAAYRAVYDAKKMKDKTVWERASVLLKNSKVAARVEELKAAIRQKHEITVDDLLRELEEARQIALSQSTPQTSSAVAATMGKAKMLGLDKQVIEHRGKVETGLPQFIIAKYEPSPSAN